MDTLEFAIRLKHAPSENGKTQDAKLKNSQNRWIIMNTGEKEFPEFMQLIHPDDRDDLQIKILICI